MKMCAPGIRGRMDDNFNKVGYCGFLDKGKVSDLEGL